MEGETKRLKTTKEEIKSNSRISLLSIPDDILTKIIKLTTTEFPSKHLLNVRRTCKLLNLVATEFVIESLIVKVLELLKKKEKFMDTATAKSLEMQLEYTTAKITEKSDVRSIVRGNIHLDALSRQKINQVCALDTELRILLNVMHTIKNIDKERFQLFQHQPSPQPWFPAPNPYPAPGIYPGEPDPDVDFPPGVPPPFPTQPDPFAPFRAPPPGNFPFPGVPKPRYL